MFVDLKLIMDLEVLEGMEMFKVTEDSWVLKGHDIADV